MILDLDLAIKILEASEQVPEHIKVGRDTRKTMRALIDGKDFKEELAKIEKIELSEDKWKARKKYSKSIKDMSHRLLRPLDNVYSATGGTKNFNIDNDDKLRDFVKMLSHIKGNMSLRKWLQMNWMHVYVTDPAGVIFMESNKDGTKSFPTYKSSDAIRNYEPKGQNLEWILFEPKDIKTSMGIEKLYRLVDDVKDWRFIKKGSRYIEITEGDLRSIEHPYGITPGIIDSDITEVGENIRLSAIEEVTELLQEYLRDKSIKTIVKFLNGFKNLVRPKIVCPSCRGTLKDGTDTACKDCDGKGFLINRDVTDEIVLPIDMRDPDKKIPSAKELANWIGLDTETWDQYTTELKILEIVAFETVWGTHQTSQDNNTATGKFIDTQPVINRLNKFSDTAEFVEWQIVQWIANFTIPGRNKEEPIAEINYGRRFIIESPDTILEKYNLSREKGLNSLILDRLLVEYITAKYRTDQENLRRNLIRMRVEPHIHLTVEQVNDIFGNEEAQKKSLFRDWWELKIGDDLSNDIEKLIEEFETWFDQQQA